MFYIHPNLITFAQALTETERDGAMKEFVEFIAKHLVENPESVKVSEVNGAYSTVYELKVAPNDMGKIIGKHGRNVQAFRVVLNALARKAGKHATLEIVEGGYRR